MPVLASFRGGHFHNFAGTTLEHHIAIFAETGTLGREGLGGPRLSRVKVHISFSHLGQLLVAMLHGMLKLEG